MCSLVNSFIALFLKGIKVAGIRGSFFVSFVPVSLKTPNQKTVYCLYGKLSPETKWKGLWMFGCTTIKWEASGCLPGHRISSLSLMKQMWTVHRLKTSVKFWIEFMVPAGEYLDGCQMWQIAGFWPLKRESQTDICSQQRRRDLTADITERKCILLLRLL